jgi:hypothetical protein
MEGIEPSTSPLPRECSATELHQPCFVEGRYLRPLRTALCLPNSTRNAKNPNSTHARLRYLPGSRVSQTPMAATAITPSATYIRCCDPGPSIGSYLTAKLNGAQGRIRTFVATSAADLQSAAINHSATCALCLLCVWESGCWSWRRDLNPRPSDYKSDALPAELRQPTLLASPDRHQPKTNPHNKQRCQNVRSAVFDFTTETGVERKGPRTQSLRQETTVRDAVPTRLPCGNSGWNETFVFLAKYYSVVPETLYFHSS